MELTFRKYISPSPTNLSTNKLSQKEDDEEEDDDV
jgi:hypothetical protein